MVDTHLILLLNQLLIKYPGIDYVVRLYGDGFSFTFMKGTFAIFKDKTERENHYSLLEEIDILADVKHKISFHVRFC